MIRFCTILHYNRIYAFLCLFFAFSKVIDDEDNDVAVKVLKEGSFFGEVKLLVSLRCFSIVSICANSQNWLNCLGSV